MNNNNFKPKLATGSLVLVRNFILFYFLCFSHNALGISVENESKYETNYKEYNTTINITEPEDALVVEMSKTKEKKKYFNNHHFYFYGGYNPFTPTWNIGFGMYIFKFNLELDAAGLYKESIIINDESMTGINASLLAGYGINLGNRFRLTPQIGWVTQTYNSIGKEYSYHERPEPPSYNRFTIATKIDFAVCDLITLSFTPKYIFNDKFEHGIYCNLNLTIGVTDLLYNGYK